MCRAALGALAGALAQVEVGGCGTHGGSGGWSCRGARSPPHGLGGSCWRVLWLLWAGSQAEQGAMLGSRAQSLPLPGPQHLLWEDLQAPGWACLLGWAGSLLESLLQEAKGPTVPSAPAQLPYGSAPASTPVSAWACGEGCRGARGWQWGAAHRLGQDMRHPRWDGPSQWPPASSPGSKPSVMGSSPPWLSPALGRREQGWTPAGSQSGSLSQPGGSLHSGLCVRCPPPPEEPAVCSPRSQRGGVCPLQAQASPSREQWCPAEDMPEPCLHAGPAGDGPRCLPGEGDAARWGQSKAWLRGRKLLASLGWEGEPYVPGPLGVQQAPLPALGCPAPC